MSCFFFVSGMSEAKTDSNLPWVEKYRPNGLEDVIAHEDIISTSMSLCVG